MSSNLKVNSIVPATGNNVAIGTAGGTISYNASVSGISTFSNGISVGTGGTVIKTTASGLVGIGTAIPSKQITVGAAITTSEFQVSPHAGGWDIGVTSGNIHPHYQTDFSVYTGQIGSGTARFSIDSSGRVTMPNQPIFMAYGNTTQTLNTGATPVKIEFTATEDIDNGGYFDAPNSNFNVPVAGKYFVYASVMLNSNFTDYGYIFMDFGKNGNRIAREIMCPRPGGGSFVSVQGSAIISAAAGDTLQVYLNQSGGTAAGVRNAYRHFTGYLIG